jgi:hypothetical protein
MQTGIHTRISTGNNSTSRPRGAVVRAAAQRSGDPWVILASPVRISMRDVGAGPLNRGPVSQKRTLTAKIQNG